MSGTCAAAGALLLVYDGVVGADEPPEVTSAVACSPGMDAVPARCPFPARGPVPALDAVPARPALPPRPAVAARVAEPDRAGLSRPADVLCRTAPPAALAPAGVPPPAAMPAPAITPGMATVLCMPALPVPPDCADHPGRTFLSRRAAHARRAWQGRRATPSCPADAGHLAAARRQHRRLGSRNRCLARARGRRVRLARLRDSGRLGRGSVAARRCAFSRCAARRWRPRCAAAAD